MRSHYPKNQCSRIVNQDEAFSIWSEWGRVYPSRTASSKLISEITKTYYLVNIIHHGYLEPDFLWEFLEA
jgi:methylenetetrahydrofolate reductase (NADPH)